MTKCHGYKGGRQGPHVTSTLKLWALMRVRVKTMVKTKVKLKRMAKKKDGEEG